MNTLQNWKCSMQYIIAFLHCNAFFLQKNYLSYKHFVFFDKKIIVMLKCNDILHFQFCKIFTREFRYLMPSGEKAWAWLLIKNEKIYVWGIFISLPTAIKDNFRLPAACGLKSRNRIWKSDQFLQLYNFIVRESICIFSI